MSLLCRSRGIARARRAGAAGYTIVELMMSLTVLAIGVTGIVAMQQVTVVANQHAKNLAIGTHIAQAWLDRLVIDAAQWNHPSNNHAASDLGETRWLKKKDDEQSWFQPEYDVTLKFGPAFDALGNVTDNPNLMEYCTHLRLRELFPDSQGNGLIRAEVRVFWVKQGVGGIPGQQFCGSTTDEDAIGEAIEHYNFVYMTSAIRQNQARQ